MNCGIPISYSSYRRYAVDFDGDGVRDLVDNVDDAIGSVASYLERHGWRRGEGIAVRAEPRGSVPERFVKAGIKPSLTVDEIRLADVGVDESVPEGAKVAFMKFVNKKGPEYWVGQRNFYAITRYNHSRLYALAVYQLALEIRRRADAG